MVCRARNTGADNRTKIAQSVKYGQDFANATNIDRLKVFREMADSLFTGDRNAVLSFCVGTVSGHPGTNIFDLGFWQKRRRSDLKAAVILPRQCFDFDGKPHRLR